MRKTKIVCTIGPASSSEEVFAEMCKAGLNVARLNFSHGTHEEHQQKFDMIHKVRKALGPAHRHHARHQGAGIPHLYLQKQKDACSSDGDAFTFTTRQVEGDETIVGVSYAGLANDLSVGDTVLVNNGLVIFTVERIEGTEIHCRVVVGGELSDRKSMSFPRQGARAGLSRANGTRTTCCSASGTAIDFVAASFVSRRQDRAGRAGNSSTRTAAQDIEIIAKIENQTGIDNVEEICEVCSGIMIGRGDLGVEVPFAELPGHPETPHHQVPPARQAGHHGHGNARIHDPQPRARPVRRSPTWPTPSMTARARSCSPASPPRASTRCKTVQTMAEIVEETEKHIDYETLLPQGASSRSRTWSTPSRTRRAAWPCDIGAKTIVVSSLSGATVRMVSRFRVPVDIVGMATERARAGTGSRSPGASSRSCARRRLTSTDVLFYNALHAAKKAMHLHKGDNIVMTAGNTNGASGNTNLIKVETI